MLSATDDQSLLMICSTLHKVKKIFFCFFISVQNWFILFLIFYLLMSFFFFLSLSSSHQLQAQKLRLARSQGPYYGGSLPNVNQIGRNPQDFQVTDCHILSLLTCFVCFQLFCYWYTATTADRTVFGTTPSVSVTTIAVLMLLLLLQLLCLPPGQLGILLILILFLLLWCCIISAATTPLKKMKGTWMVSV